jgi:cytochrome c biogenesis protein CcmG, thiol:disulfide interchange protein DsbE
VRRQRAVALVGAALAVLLAGCGSGSAGSSGTTGAAAARTTLAPPPACPRVPEVTAPAVAGGLPATTLRCLGSGPAVRLSDLRGTPTVVSFWAAWCTECRVEMPYFRAAMAQGAGRVRFLGVHAWADGDFGRQSVTDFGVPFASLDGGDGNEVPASMKVPAPPTTLFVDATGKVVGRQIGVFHSREQLSQAIRRYLGVAA